jgi:hypothetical protein
MNSILYLIYERDVDTEKKLHASSRLYVVY